MVCTTSKNVCTATISSASDKKFVNKSTGQKSSSSRNIVTEISGVEAFWQSLQMEGNLNNASRLISHSRRKISTNFESAWGQWTGRCNERQVNPFQATVNYMINYLSEKFDKGLQYRTLHCLKSAISVYHFHVDGTSVRKHPKVSALLAGIFNQRPPQPRYVFIRVIEIVLQHIRTHWYYNSSLNDEELTWISHSFEGVHDTAPLAKDKARYIFCFSKLQKSCRECQAPPALTCFSFGEEKALYVVETLN